MPIAPLYLNAKCCQYVVISGHSERPSMRYRQELPSHKHNFPMHYMAVLADWAQAHGCPTSRLLAQTTLRPADLQRVGDYVSTQDLAQMVSNAYAATGIASLGIEFGARLNISSHTALGHAIMNCATFGQVMQVFLKYYRIVAPDVRMTVAQDQQQVYLTLTVTEREILPEQFAIEVCFAAIYTSARFLLQVQSIPFALELAYPAPTYAAEYMKFFGANTQFGCAQHRLCFPRELIDRIIPSGNAALLAIFEQQCAQLLAAIEGNDNCGDKVRLLLRKMEGHYPSFEQVADLLALSPRTLRRRLGSEGLRYSVILGEVRLALATELLSDSRLSLSGIAYRLGYNDVSNFRRAFIQWTGKSPSDYQRAGR